MEDNEKEERNPNTRRYYHIYHCGHQGPDLPGSAKYGAKSMFFGVGGFKGRRLAHSSSLLHWLIEGFRPSLIGSSEVELPRQKAKNSGYMTEAKCCHGSMNLSFFKATAHFCHSRKSEAGPGACDLERRDICYSF